MCFVCNHGSQMSFSRDVSLSLWNRTNNVQDFHMFKVHEKYTPIHWWFMDLGLVTLTQWCDKVQFWTRLTWVWYRGSACLSCTYKCNFFCNILDHGIFFNGYWNSYIHFKFGIWWKEERWREEKNKKREKLSNDIINDVILR